MDSSPLEPHKLGIDLENLPPVPRSKLRLVLDNVRSAHNVGALFRTADAAACEKIHLLGVTPHPPQNQLEKTALGATQYLQWASVEDTSECVTELSSKGYTLVALDNGPQAIDLWDFRWPEKTALIAGNEISGVSAQLLENCVFRVNLPMFGYKRSLNVTTAMGIAIYDYLRTFRLGQG